MVHKVKHKIRLADNVLKKLEKDRKDYIVLGCPAFTFIIYIKYQDVYTVSQISCYRSLDTLILSIQPRNVGT